MALAVMVEQAAIMPGKCSYSYLVNIFEIEVTLCKEELGKAIQSDVAQFPPSPV